MSSTAKTILETLVKMSSPNSRDAQQRTPMPRAERRRALAEELLRGDGGQTSARRRPRLGQRVNDTRHVLNGPPLRTNFSVTPAVRRIPESVHRKPSPEKRMETVSQSDFNEKKDESKTTGGKIRSKLGEKAKARAERVLEQTEDSNVSYLSNLTKNNPLLKMTTLPTFQFGNKAKSDEIEKNQSILTSPALNRVVSDKPEPNNAAIKVMEKVFNNSAEEKSSANTSATLSTSSSSSSSANTSSNENHEFVFSQPERLNLPRDLDSSQVKAAQHTFVFSQPKQVSSSSNVSTSSNVSSSSHNSSVVPMAVNSGALPDLTAGVPSTVAGNLNKSPPSINNSTANFINSQISHNNQNSFGMFNNSGGSNSNNIQSNNFNFSSGFSGKKIMPDAIKSKYLTYLFRSNI